MALDDIVGDRKRSYRGGGRRGEGDRERDREKDREHRDYGGYREYRDSREHREYREYREYRSTKPRGPRDPEEDKRKVLVENLNYKTSWQDLKDHMRGAGTVERADIVIDREGKSTGKGYGRDLC